MMNTSTISDEQIARICHEVNRAYCAAMGDHSQPDWDNAPDWQVKSAVAGVRFIRTNPDASPSASHESWMEEKRRDGWSYGPVKDPARKQHPCFVAYEDLPIEQRAKDYLFGAVVRSLLAGAIFDLASFSLENLFRCSAPNGFNHPLSAWSLSDWMTATAGELGEAANVLKKLNRVRDGIPGNTETPQQLRQQLSDEIADTLIYLDLLAQAAGIDLSTAVRAKFDRTSVKIGYRPA